MTVFSTVSAIPSDISQSSVLEKYPSMMWLMISAEPAAVWYFDTLNV